MQSVKKWLFPVLTCFLVAVAAVLPARISIARDERRFREVYTEPLDPDVMSGRDPMSLLDRLDLYARQYSVGHPILSFREDVPPEAPEGDEIVQKAQELLTGEGILPHRIFKEEPFDQMTVIRLLLWDPGDAEREPSAFWEIYWSYYTNRSHQKRIQLVLDAETEVPIQLYVHDTNMSQWLPYGTEELRGMAERFLSLLGEGMRETEPDNLSSSYDLNLCYSVEGAPVRFISSRSPTSCSIEAEPDLQYQAESKSESIG